MKFLSTTLIALLTMLFTVFCNHSFAQNIDTNRMERDINIMENVLKELFKTTWEAKGSDVHIRAGSFPFLENNDIEGIYLPGFGVIFTIPGGPPAFVASSNATGDTFSFNFQYSNDEKGEAITEESVTNKIVEFLRDYGPAIGQLANDDKVMVIYRANRPNFNFDMVRLTQKEEDTKKQMLPSISVVAQARDLKAYRSGNLNDTDFRSRLDIRSVDASEQQEKDLKVLGSILKTSFENSDESIFHIRGSVDYLKLDNFGALFSFDVRFSDWSPFDFSALGRSLEALREGLAKTRIRIQEQGLKGAIDSIKIDSIKIETDLTEMHEKRNEVRKQREEQKEKIIEAYNQFLTDLKTTIADYGRTLNSVDPGQQVLFSVSLNSRIDEVPNHLTLHISKSVLENSSRDEIIDRIKVYEN
ncbi:MAG: hypothetical protein U5J95_10380 [Balneolaceae bacterium]|nr:hypothetical protein [Balneolaceae bacterium]